jgi:MFS family permease
MSPFTRTFIALYIAIFMASLGIGILAPILPAYVDQHSASALMLGVIFGSYSAARTILMPPIGIYSDRIGRRVFIFAGLFLFTVVSPLYSFAANPVQLIAVRFLHGVAGAMLMPVAMSAIGDISPRGREGFVMGSFTSAFFAGLGFGPLIGGYMRDRFSVAAAFNSMGVLSAAALVFAVLALPPLGPEKGKKAGNDDFADNEADDVPVNFLADPPLIGLLFFRFTRAVGIGLVWVIMPLMAVKSLGNTALQVGIMLSSNTFITTVLQVPMGHLSDRIGHRISITAGSGLACAAIAFIAWAGSFLDLLLASLALGIAGALIVPAGSAMAVVLGRNRGMGRTMGLYNSSLSLGTMLGPVIGGALLDFAGVRTVFIGGALLGAAGWLVLILSYRPGLLGIESAVK